MKGFQWLLWIMALIFSSFVKGRLDAARKSPWYGNHRTALSSTVIRYSVTPPRIILFKSEQGQQREPLQPVRSDRYIIIPSCSAAVSREAVNIPPRNENASEKSSKTLGMQNGIKGLKSPAIEGQVEKIHEFKKGLTLPGDSQLADQQDPMHNPEQAVLMKTSEAKEILLESQAFRGYFPQLEPLLTSPKNSHTDRRYTDRRRRSTMKKGVGQRHCDNCTLSLSLAKVAAPDLDLLDLVLYLISLTSGRQIYLVYDDVTPGVGEVALAMQEWFGDTMFLPYDPSLLLLKEVLDSNYHVQPMRNVFIFCSHEHLIELFEQVREKVLESPTIQWFVIVDKDMRKELLLLLREGTQVALVQRVTPQTAMLFSSRVNPDGHIGFHLAERWSVRHSWRTSSQPVRGGLVPNLQHLYSDLEGRQLVITTNDNWPFFKIDRLENASMVPVAGIEFNIVKYLGEKLNFTYKVTTSPDGNWGGPKPDGTITGLIGQVARHEAHATLCELTITDIRETVVDFTLPYYLDSMTVVSLAPKERNRAFAILSPFTVQVWLYILLATVLVGPLLYMEARLLVVCLGKEDGPHYSLQSFSFNMYRNLVLQGNLINTHHWSLRFTFFFWYLFCLYMYAMYSGTLTAAFAVISFEKPFNSLYDLARAKRDGYTIATGRDTNYESTFRRATSGIYREVWQLFNHEDPDKSFFATRHDGLDMMEKHKYVYINGLASIRLDVIRRGRHKFYIGRDTFLPQSYGIACSSGSPFKDVFSTILIHLRDVGLVDKWMNDEVNKVAQYVPTASDSGPKPISLQHLQAAFFVMALGFVISALVLATEILIRISYTRIHKKRSIKQIDSGGGSSLSRVKLQDDK